MRGPLARTFNVSPTEIWPNSEKIASPELEVINTWKHLQDVPTDIWVELTQDTNAKRIDVLAGSGTRLTEGVPRLDEIIRAHDVFGATIRICFGDPESEHTKYRDSEEGLDGTFASRIKRSILEWQNILEGLQNAELRVYNLPYYHSTYRFGDRMLIAHHGYKQFGTRSATILIQRADQFGIFDNYAENFERVWEDSRRIAIDPTGPT